MRQQYKLIREIYRIYIHCVLSDDSREDDMPRGNTGEASSEGI